MTAFIAMPSCRLLIHPADVVTEEDDPRPSTYSRREVEPDQRYERAVLSRCYGCSEIRQCQMYTVIGFTRIVLHIALSGLLHSVEGILILRYSKALMRKQ